MQHQEQPPRAVEAEVELPKELVGTSIVDLSALSFFITVPMPGCDGTSANSSASPLPKPRRQLAVLSNLGHVVGYLDFEISIQLGSSSGAAPTSNATDFVTIHQCEFAMDDFQLEQYLDTHRVKLECLVGGFRSRSDKLHLKFGSLQVQFGFFRSLKPVKTKSCELVRLVEGDASNCESNPANSTNPADSGTALCCTWSQQFTWIFPVDMPLIQFLCHQPLQVQLIGTRHHRTPQH